MLVQPNSPPSRWPPSNHRTTLTASESASSATGSWPEAHRKDLINAAYDLQPGSNDEILAGPAWSDSSKFDVEAKTDQAKSSRFMLQALLTDRFKLKFHTETRDLPVYDLVVARNGASRGPRLTPSPPEQPATAAPSSTTAFGAIMPTPSSDHWHGGRMIGRGQLKATYETMSVFGKFLQFQPELAGRCVIDKTGLTAQ